MTLTDLFPTWYLGTVATVLGLVMGSFLACLSSRLAAGQSALGGRSRCDSCGHPLSALDLVPILSYLFLGGRCRYCKTKIPASAPLSEALCGIAYLSVFLRFGPTWEALRFLVLLSLFFAAALVDLEAGWVPDRFPVFGVAFYLASAFLKREEALSLIIHGLLGAAMVFIPLFLLVLAADKLLGRPTMGGGDLKLYALAGLYLGWQEGLLFLFLSCIFGLGTAALMGRLKPDTPFPFVPAMALAAWTTVLTGPTLVAWYASFFY